MENLEERIAYWKKQIDLFGKQSIYWSDIKIMEETLKEMKELKEENQRLETELMMAR